MGLMSSQITTKTLVPLCRQLSTSFNAGIPIIRALDLVADNTRDRRACTVLREMSDQIQEGATLGQAARTHAKYLPPFFIELIASGEVGGRLDAMLADLADYYEDRLDIRRKAVAAAIYPTLQILFAWFLGTWALGWIKGFSFGMEPFDLGNYFAAYLRFQGIALTVFALLFAACVVLARLGILKWISGWFSTFIWPLATVTRWFALARFFRSLSLLIASGLPITECIKRAAGVVGNPYIERDLLQAVPLVKEGTSLVGAFAGSRFLTPTAREMLAVGEQSGELDTALQKVSQYHLAQATHSVQVATRIGAVLVGLVVAAIIGYVLITFWSNYYGKMLDSLGV